MFSNKPSAVASDCNFTICDAATFSLHYHSKVNIYSGHRIKFPLYSIHNKMSKYIRQCLLLAIYLKSDFSYLKKLENGSPRVYSESKFSGRGLLPSHLDGKAHCMVATPTFGNATPTTKCSENTGTVYMHLKRFTYTKYI